MARLSPETHNPQISFRYSIQFSLLQDIPIYGKAVSMPTIDNSPIIVDYGNTQMKVKGKTKWNDIQITCYAYERMTIDQLWQYMIDYHQDVAQASDEYADTYKKDLQIQLLGPTNNVVGTWKLIGAFASVINFGQLDWSAEEVVQPELTVAYDYGTYQSA